MVAAMFEGPLSCFLFVLVGLIYLAFKLVQTACDDSTAGKAVRGLFRRWFGGKRSDRSRNGSQP
jgi:hypothetical protein